MHLENHSWSMALSRVVLSESRKGVFSMPSQSKAVDYAPRVALAWTNLDGTADWENVDDENMKRACGAFQSTSYKLL